MNPDALESEVSAVEDELRSVGVESLAYVDHDSAYVEFVTIFAEESPELIENVTPEILPTSFKVQVAEDDCEKLERLNSLTERAGVREIVFGPNSCGMGDLGDAEFPEDDFVDDALGSTAIEERLELDPASPVARLFVRVTDVDAIVFLDLDASQNEIDAVRPRIETIDGVTEVTYLDQQAAFEEFLQMYADDPAMRERATPEELPPSFEVDLSAISCESVADLHALVDVEGVNDVVMSYGSC